MSLIDIEDDIDIIVRIPKKVLFRTSDMVKRLEYLEEIEKAARWLKAWWRKSEMIYQDHCESGLALTKNDRAEYCLNRQWKAFVRLMELLEEG